MSTPPFEKIYIFIKFLMKIANKFGEFRQNSFIKQTLHFNNYNWSSFKCKQVIPKKEQHNFFSKVSLYLSRLLKFYLKFSANILIRVH